MHVSLLCCFNISDANFPGMVLTKIPNLLCAMDILNELIQEFVLLLGLYFHQLRCLCARSV